MFRWLAIPFVQGELDSYLFQHNESIPRANHHKILPHGAPHDIFHFPADYNALDYKVHILRQSIIVFKSHLILQITPIPENVLAAAEAQWAPPNHPVFQLVPDAFQTFVLHLYDLVGSPAVEFDSFWDIYNCMMALAEGEIQMFPDAQQVIHEQGLAPDAGEDQGIPLMSHQREADFGEGNIPALLILDDLENGKSYTRVVFYDTNSSL